MPVRVLMFGWELPPFNSGGLGVACYGLTQALSQTNVDITFVLPQRVGVKADFLHLVFADLEGFDWAKFTAYSRAVSHSESVGPPPLDLLSAVEMYALRAQKIAGNFPHDLVHAHDWLCFPAGVVANSVSGKPLVIHVHATEFDRSGGAGVNPIVFALEKQGLDQADAIIAVSNFTKNLLTRHYHPAADKISVIHNGINSSEYEQIPDSVNPLAPLKAAGYKIVLYVGRITLQKGPDYFLQAAQKVLKYDPNVIFLIVGSGDMENQIIRQSVEMGLSDKVLFAGFLRGELLRRVFQSADLFVMPSVSEPFGITALESVASGTPAIVSKQSGVSEALTHVLKVDFWDTDEMTNQILSVLKYNSLHESLRTNGHHEIKDKSWSAAAAKTLAVYKKVLDKN